MAPRPVLVVCERSDAGVKDLLGSSDQYIYCTAGGRVEEARRYIHRLMVHEVIVVGAINTLALLAVIDDAEHHGLSITSRPFRSLSEMIAA